LALRTTPKWAFADVANSVVIKAKQQEVVLPIEIGGLIN
jgi:hypothetical protein